MAGMRPMTIIGIWLSWRTKRYIRIFFVTIVITSSCAAALSKNVNIIAPLRDSAKLLIEPA